MKQNRTPQRLQEMGARWLLTAQMALAFARRLLRFSEKNPRRALECAVMFELWLAAEVASLTCETAAYDCSDTEDVHMRKLHSAAMCFISLIILVQLLKAQFAAKIAQLATAGFGVFRQVIAPRAPAQSVPFIDTS